jgi:hypothetical protein
MALGDSISPGVLAAPVSVPNRSVIRRAPARFAGSSAVFRGPSRSLVTAGGSASRSTSSPTSSLSILGFGPDADAIEKS